MSSNVSGSRNEHRAQLLDILAMSRVDEILSPDHNVVYVQ